jgi:exosome complex component RRP41
MDGHLTEEEFSRALDMAVEGCKKLHELQKQALIEKYGQEITPEAAQPVTGSEGGESNE